MLKPLLCYLALAVLTISSPSHRDPYDSTVDSGDAGAYHHALLPRTTAPNSEDLIDGVHSRSEVISVASDSAWMKEPVFYWDISLGKAGIHQTGTALDPQVRLQFYNNATCPSYIITDYHFQGAEERGIVRNATVREVYADIAAITKDNAAKERAKASLIAQFAALGKDYNEFAWGTDGQPPAELRSQLLSSLDSPSTIARRLPMAVTKNTAILSFTLGFAGVGILIANNHVPSDVGFPGSSLLAGALIGLFLGGVISKILVDFALELAPLVIALLSTFASAARRFLRYLRILSEEPTANEAARYRERLANVNSAVLEDVRRTRLAMSNIPLNPGQPSGPFQEGVELQTLAREGPRDCPV